MVKTKKQTEETLEEARKKATQEILENRVRADILKVLDERGFDTGEKNIDQAIHGLHLHLGPVINRHWDLALIVHIIDVFNEDLEKKYEKSPLWKVINDEEE